MVNFDLIALAQAHYGSQHYLFLILTRNDITLPADFVGGEKIILPPRAKNARLKLAAKSRRDSTFSPV
jgi:hypothetical protein